jgi:hypothetical protein
MTGRTFTPLTALARQGRGVRARAHRARVRGGRHASTSHTPLTATRVAGRDEDNRDQRIPSREADECTGGAAERPPPVNGNDVRLLPRGRVEIVRRRRLRQLDSLAAAAPARRLLNWFVEDVPDLKSRAPQRFPRADRGRLRAPSTGGGPGANGVRDADDPARAVEEDDVDWEAHDMAFTEEAGWMSIPSHEDRAYPAPPCPRSRTARKTSVSLGLTTRAASTGQLRSVKVLHASSAPESRSRREPS